MNIGLIDVDSHNFPNLALMKLSTYHKAKGDCVSMYSPLFDNYDLCYASKVFTFTSYAYFPYNTIKGGSGYNITEKLPDAVEHSMPDYSLYNIKDTAYGYLTRGCPRRCGFCIVADKEGAKSIIASPLNEFWNGQKNIVLFDPNILACAEAERLLIQLAKTKSKVDFTQGLDARLLTEDRVKLLQNIKTSHLHFAMDTEKGMDAVLHGLKLLPKNMLIKSIIFVLVNYDTNFEFDLERCRIIKSLGAAPMVMIYDKEHATKKYKDLARWANRRWFFRSFDFSEYNSKTRRLGGKITLWN